MGRKKKTDTIQASSPVRPFVMVYHDFLSSDLLKTSYQKMIYICLQKFINSDKQAFPSIKTLSRMSKISETKVKKTLNELIEIGVLKKEMRYRDDGGNTSNLYTLYDSPDLWGTSEKEEAAAVIQREDLERAIKLVTESGYAVTQKEKEPDYHPTKDDNQTQKQDQFNLFNTTKNSEKSQEVVTERYSLEQIKVLYDYEDALIVAPSKAEDYETVMGILHDTLNSTSDQIKVAGQNRPTLAVIGKLHKLTMEHILYVIDKYRETLTTTQIKAKDKYLLSMLYNAKEQMELDVSGQVIYDMAHWNDEK